MSCIGWMNVRMVSIIDEEGMVSPEMGELVEVYSILIAHREADGR